MINTDAELPQGVIACVKITHSLGDTDKHLVTCVTS